MSVIGSTASLDGYSLAAWIMAAERSPRLTGVAGVGAMLVKGISRGDLEAAVEIASGTLGNRLELYAMYRANRSGGAWRFRVKVADPDAPGARRYFRRYRLGLTKAPNRSHNPCTHALGALCVAIFERKPYAQVETSHPAFLGGVRFRDVREFLSKYKEMVNRERGECTCETDDIETGTIDGSGVIFGAYVPRGRERVNGR
ncbi:MAG: hypothetical protein M3317_07925 [Actinomycetota bacterium]|nr:hypothetical protein [Actinomycetota bacterium]